MPLDPSIIIQPRRVAAISPQEAQESALRLSQLQNAVNEQQSQQQDRKTIADLYRNNVDASGNLNASGVTKGLAQAGLGDRIPQFQNSQAEYGKTVAGMNSEQLKFHKLQLDAVNSHLATLLAKPDVSHDDVIASISDLVDQGMIDSASGAKMVQQLPGPEQLKPWLTQRALEGLDQSKKMEMVLPKYDEQDRGGVINQGTINQVTGERTAGKDVQKTPTPDEKLKSENKPQFGGRTQSLLAALASRGVSLPAGFRSQAQMASTLNGLLGKYPDKTEDEIAEAIASGQINFGAEKKETNIAAGLAGKIRYAENEIKQITPLIRQASALVPRGDFVSWNKLKQLGDAQISDPNLKEFKSYMNTLSNAYDMLAARGGTDVEKRAHNREMFDTADSPEALEAALQAVENEASISGKAADDAMRPWSQRDQPPPAANAVPDDIAVLLKKHGGK
jgi:hypothetical protein